MNNQDWRPEDDMLQGILGFAALTLIYMLIALLEQPIAMFLSFTQ